MKTWVVLACIPALLLGLPACKTGDYGYKVVVANGHHGGQVHAPAPHRKPGPPPHAPAHGYRHKHAAHGVDLVYDSGLGVYAVVGYENRYYQDGFFFRYSGDHWEMSVGIEDGARWEYAPSRSVPPGLKNKGGKHTKKGKANGKGKGRGNSQGRQH